LSGRCVIYTGREYSSVSNVTPNSASFLKLAGL
jgi:hypothetical protein